MGARPQPHFRVGVSRRPARSGERALDQVLDGEKFCLAFECVLRRLEIIQLPQEEKDRIINLYKDNQMIGFHTYGEQLGGVHINQTLTGVAFGTKRNKV